MKRLFIILLLIAVNLFAAGPYKDNNMNKLNKIAGPEDRKYNIHDGNKILTIFFNYGDIGEWQGVSRIRSGIYPKGSGHSYFAEFSPIVGGEVTDANGNVIHIFTDGLGSTTQMDLSPEGKPWRFEPLPGYANPNQDKIAMNDDQTTWPDSWPDKPADWNGKWNGQYGKYARADQESYFVMNDYYNDEFEFYPDPADSSMRGMGLEVKVRGYQWSNTAAEDILIWTYLITNTSKTDYEKMVFGMYGDADVGDNGDQRDDDANWDTDYDMVFQYDHDGKGVWGGKPAYFGYKFLESPGNPYDNIDNDNDGMVDESQYDGIDNDGDWNPETDDIGTDGIGPSDPGYLGPDPDGTEGNGKPDPGEPNFEYTDNDESDQIGLTSFRADVWPNITAKDDEKLWDWTKPASEESFEIPEQTVDLTFLYGSGYFPLSVGDTKKFAIAMLFGEDEEDIKRNAATMQKIYDADYSFAKAPLKPKVWAVAGDGYVTLYWDDRAESSKDHIYGYDFEGYRIYKSTDPSFIESWIITDAWGNKTFNKPVAQFDLIDGLKGPHPVAFNGIQYDMGNDTGLRHQWTDYDVQNGQVYYYAVVSYDKGYYQDFYDKGICDQPGLPDIAPSECSKIIEVDAAGNVLSTDINTVVVKPEAPAAGFVPPSDLSTENNLIKHITGISNSKITVSILDPLKVHSDWKYYVTFKKDNSKIYFSIKNDNYFSEQFKADTMWVFLSKKNIDSTTVYFDESAFVSGVDYILDPVDGKIKITEASSMEIGQTYTINFKYYPVYNSDMVNGELNNPIFDGMHVILNDYGELQVDLDNTGWVEGDCNFDVSVKEFRNGSGEPADYEIIFKGEAGDSVSADVFYNYPAPFIIKNTLKGIDADFIIKDIDKDKKWSYGDNILILFDDTTGSLSLTKRISWNVTIKEPSDTTIVPNAPESGDVFVFKTLRPFTENDTYEFSPEEPYIDKVKAKNELDKVAVVPNPYVIAASWEPKHLFEFGRGPRKIEFIHLPNICTIKIYTLNGYLVKKIEHNSAITDGSESWDLISKEGLEISYGIYIYHIKAPGIGEKIGKFAVIK